MEKKKTYSEVMSDPFKQVEESTNLEYLTNLSRYVDMDIENTNNDVNKSIDIRVRKLTEEEYQEKKRKGLVWFQEFKTRIENRITKLKQKTNENI